MMIILEFVAAVAGDNTPPIEMNIMAKSSNFEPALA